MGVSVCLWGCVGARYVSMNVCLGYLNSDRNKNRQADTHVEDVVEIKKGGKTLVSDPAPGIHDIHFSVFFLEWDTL